MSVFGGDSWGREAEHRKRRVDDLIVDGLHHHHRRSSSSSSSSSVYKKLSNGKYSCLVCPHSPILDTSLVLSMHMKGSRHRAAESRLKEAEFVRENERNKRIALSDCSTGSAKLCTHSRDGSLGRVGNKPLIQQARRTASEIVFHKTTTQLAIKESKDVTFGMSHPADGSFDPNSDESFHSIGEFGETAMQQQVDLQERREKELKFTAAGWKRDCLGKWFRDENVEFDSDEDDPNDCIAQHITRHHGNFFPLAEILCDYLIARGFSRSIVG